MRRSDWQPPVITIDQSLVKSTAENNKKATSEIGDYLGIRTPNVKEVVPLKLPKFTATVVPNDKELEKIDYNTPFEKLIEPHKVMQTQKEIQNWFKNNQFLLDRPMQYLGNETNVQRAEEYDTADVRLLICRLSPYDAVGGSTTHGALAQILHEKATAMGIKLYIDFAFMPGNNEDALFLEENRVPWAFGRTSKRHPKDFDAMLISFALTMETINIWPFLKFSGIPLFKTQRHMNEKLRESQYPLMVAGGVVSDILEGIHGPVDGHEGALDAIILGDGEITLDKLLEGIHNSLKTNMTKGEFLRSMHSPKNPWWYETDLYSATYDETPDPKTGYRELRKLERKPGAEYAMQVGELKRVYMDDLNGFKPFTKIPIFWDGCINGAARVITPDGIQKVEDLVDSGPGKILTQEGVKDYNGVLYQGERPTIEIKTRFGKQIWVTENHKLQIITESGDLVWVRADELKLGDRILSKRGDSGMIPEDRGADADLYFLTGVLYGDGSLGTVSSGRSAQFTITEREKDLLGQVKGILDNNGIQYTERYYSPEELNESNKGSKNPLTATEGKYTLRTYESWGKIFFDILPSYESEGKWKNAVPQQLWRAGKSQLRAFIQGLSTTDGCVSGGQLAITTKWEGLSKDTQTILETLGVVTTRAMNQRKETNSLGTINSEWNVRTVGTAAAKHWKSPFSLDNKSEAILAGNQSTNTLSKRTHTNLGSDKFLGIPYPKHLIIDLFPTNLECNKRVLGALYSLMMKIKKNQRMLLPENRIQEVLEKARIYGKSESAITLLENVLNKGWYFDQVTSLQDGGTMKVYDPASVAETESYVADGLINHNTLGNSVDVQISSGCLCIAGSSVIETEFGFETIKECFERLSDGETPIVKTRFGQFSSDGVVYAGKKKVRTYTFVNDDEGWEYKFTCTDEHKLDVMEVPDEREPCWRQASEINIGEEVWVVELPDYEDAKSNNGKINKESQFYNTKLTTAALKSVSDYFEQDCYDIQNVDEHNEYIADGVVCHNSGGLCSFCVAGDSVTSLVNHKQIKIEDLTDDDEIETPYGVQNPAGVILKGEEECLKITTKRGHYLISTPDHKIMTYIDNKIGLTAVKDLKVGDPVQISQYAVKEISAEVRPLRDFLFPEPKRGEALPEGVKKFDDRPKEEQEVMKALRKAGAFLDELVSIEPAGVREVWDIWDVPKGHLYFANGFIISNCFVPETPVITAHGTSIPINEIRPGMQVLTAKGTVTDVVRVYKRTVDEILVSIHLEGIDTKISGTKNHKVASYRGEAPPTNWEGVLESTLGELEIGDYITGPGSDSESPKWIKVHDISYFPYSGEVFNLEVSDEDHSYQVGNAEIPDDVKAILEEIETLTESEKELLLI